jgi:hypothetical protein
MSNVNLLALQNAINTNTLTLAQQAALSNALSEIIPTFPEPDEISNSIPFDEEALARDWMAALYAVAIAGGSSGVLPVPTGTIIAPTAANLSATAVTGLPNGTPAIVETFGSEFTLQPIGGMTVDGVTVLASPDPTRVWERGDTVVAVASALVDAWFVNPATGNDENTGGTPPEALKTKAEIARRLGSWSPVLDNVHVTITYLSADTLPDDPGQFAPSFINGATLVETAPLPAASFTGVLLAVTAKNRPGNTALSSTVTPTTGAIAVGMMLVNATRGNSRAFVVRDKGGGNWLLTQPLMPYNPPALPTQAEVDTWANGDAITGYHLIPVNLVHAGGMTGDFDASFDASHVVYQLDVQDPAGFGLDPFFVDGRTSTAWVECNCHRAISLGPGSSPTTIQVQNVFCQGGILQAEGISTSVSPLVAQWSAGMLVNAGTDMVGCKFTNDVVLPGGQLEFFNCSFNDIYYDTATQVLAQGNLNVGGAQYGAGVLNAVGTVNYDFTPSAVAAFPLSAGITINGSTSAYSNLTTGGVVATHEVALTPANLDAAAGAAGFGGLAYIPGAGTFIKGTVIT